MSCVPYVFVPADKCVSHQNFNIYKRLFLDLINIPDTDGPDSYRTWADLRTLLLQLVNKHRAEKSFFIPV